jgi:hypothetical protein
VLGTCKCGNEPSGSIKCQEFLGYLRTIWLLKDSAPRSERQHRTKGYVHFYFTCIYLCTSARNIDFSILIHYSALVTLCILISSKYCGKQHYVIHVCNVETMCVFCEVVYRLLSIIWRICMTVLLPVLTSCSTYAYFILHKLSF